MDKKSDNGADRASISHDLLADLDSQVAQALDHQERLTREAEILQAKSEVAREYRNKFMDLRDKLRAKISSANAEPTDPA